MIKREVKVGVFIAIGIAVLIWATLNLRSLPIFNHSGYQVVVLFETAEGLRPKTPVEVAGIEVGYVEKVELLGSKVAKITLQIQEGVVLPVDTAASVKSKGFLGETYINLEPGVSTKRTEPGEQIQTGKTFGDVNSLTEQLSDIARDVKVITSALRVNVEGENSRLTRILENMEILTHNLATITERNSAHLDQIVENVALLTQDLKLILQENRPNMDATFDRIASVTQKIDEGKGTLGKLINDDATVERLNDSLDSLNETLGTVGRLRTEIGYHMEYMTASNDFKHYVDFKLKPRPDKYFLIELVSDPSPSPIRVQEERTVTSGGTSSTVTTETETASQDNFAFSAQLAKELYDFTIRGGMIESRGGLGLDYNKGPLGISFSAFDFQSNEDENPHLKAWAHLNVTNNFYLMSGVDDFVSNQQDPDWFVGVGVQFVDDDVKSLLGLSQLAR